MRKLATIREILEIRPIEGADFIEATRVDGWWCVVKKGEFALNDKVIYCEVDSFLPLDERYEFLRKSSYKKMLDEEGYRLKSSKFRNCISQGLILPLHSFPELVNCQLGDDVTNLLKIKLYSPPIPACLGGIVKGLFPSFGRKTDQERLENLEYEVFVENKNSLFEVTIKLDGASCSVYYYNGESGVCSRNLDFKIIEENKENSFIATATKTGLISALKNIGKNYMVSAELMGPGIQGNKEKLKETDLFIFDIYNIDTGKYLSSSDRKEIFSQLCNFGFTGQHVPIVVEKTTLQDIGVVDVATSKIYVDRKSFNSSIAEGCVFKRIDGLFSFKSINNKFLLKLEE